MTTMNRRWHALYIGRRTTMLLTMATLVFSGGMAMEILELELLLEQGSMDLEIFFETLDIRLKEVVENL